MDVGGFGVAAVEGAVRVVVLVVPHGFVWGDEQLWGEEREKAKRRLDLKVVKVRCNSISPFTSLQHKTSPPGLRKARV